MAGTAMIDEHDMHLSKDGLLLGSAWLASQMETMMNNEINMNSEINGNNEINVTYS